MAGGGMGLSLITVWVMCARTLEAGLDVGEPTNLRFREERPDRQ